MKFHLSPKISNLALASLLGSSLLEAGIVTNTADSGAGSLRDVLAASVNGDTITFDLTLAGSTIVLTGGELAITGKQVTIDASALPPGISISGNNSSRILNISSGSNVTLKNLTLRNGKEDNGNFGEGGALLAEGGALNMTGCVIKDSQARTGGGLYLKGSIQVTINRCSIIGNQGDLFGGGIFLSGVTSATVTNSVISGNRSLVGGGIYNPASSPSLINCTIQGNAGEGVYGQSSFTFVTNIRNCIIWGNRVGNGSIATQQIRSEGNASSNVDYSLVEGRAATLHNLGGTDSDSANIPKFVSPALPANAPISSADVRLLIGSTSINAGNNADISQPLDRAGFPRIQDTTVDMGAFENGYVTFAALHPSLLPSGDENHNGISNYQEYALGLDPAGTSTFAALPALSTSGGFRFLTSNRRINGLDVFTNWTTSTTLQALSWQTMVPGVNYLIDSTSIPSPGRQQLVFKLLDTDPSRFYRQEFSTGN